MVEIQIPEKVNKIIHTLQEHGYEAYAVGGCVKQRRYFHIHLIQESSMEQLRCFSITKALK